MIREKRRQGNVTFHATRCAPSPPPFGGKNKTKKEKKKSKHPTNGLRGSSRQSGRISSRPPRDGYPGKAAAKAGLNVYGEDPRIVCCLLAHPFERFEVCLLKSGFIRSFYSFNYCFSDSIYVNYGIFWKVFDSTHDKVPLWTCVRKLVVQRKHQQ